MRLFGVAAAVAGLLAAVSGQAAAADLCPGVTAAWRAAKADPASIRTKTFVGAYRCSFSDDDLRCYWRFANAGEARRAYGRFGSELAACLAPLGLSPVHKVLHGVETTSLEARSDLDPDVAIFYPPDGSIVGVSIVTAN